MTIKKLKSKRGYVAITVLILMMVLAAVMYLYSDAVFSELAIARNNKSAQAAFSLAEAGVQEAVYRIQYDDAAKNVLLSTTVGVSTQFSHDPALLDRGAYDVTITNVTKGVVIVTATGQYTIGALRTAKREIKVDIAQATLPLTFPYDSGIYAAGSGAGAGSIADVDFWFAPIKIYGGSLLSNRDINFKFGANVDIEGAVEAGDNVTISNNPFPSYLDCNCLFNDDDPENPPPACSTSPGCTYLEGVPAKDIPQLDWIKYETIAKNTPGPSPDGNQYFANQQAFKAIFPPWTDKTFEGVYYINSSLDLNDFRTMRMKGVLATSGSITVGHSTNLLKFGQILVEPPSVGSASGILTQGSLTVKTVGNFSGTGLVYAGDRFQIDTSIPYDMNLTGGIISRRTLIAGFRTINIYFDATVIEAVLANPSDTPVIELNHWEEEY